MAENTAIRYEDVLAGAANYKRSVLNRYDRVLYVNCRFFWRCDRGELLRRYQAAVGARHLEIGVGSGYCPAHTLFPTPEPEITLVDLNPQTLDFASRRLAHLRPRRVLANALDPIEEAGVPTRHFDSVAINLLLHCIPGDIKAKAAVLGNAAAAVKPGGKVVGSTVLAQGVPVTPAGRFLMRQLNAKGIFHNTEDRRDDLESVLGKYFADYQLVVRGCMAMFTATVQ
ncbi:class I SAM-dependent methyltransferase [Kutzneria sp. CA-103260]|uniref:class I SAM-dependent methyltransferase n=1 Tax=Kutzneria sp. CA-103260 TaxID=2802641 RepID=UPI001BA62F61|nr:class I SAM-dependent methyltransferase [Kutzneria sp. CA-103260]QUQ65301.1 Methyltransferase domain protein [Kutzneria sp. CA-103260]